MRNIRNILCDQPRMEFENWYMIHLKTTSPSRRAANVVFEILDDMLDDDMLNNNKKLVGVHVAKAISTSPSGGPE